MPGEPARRPWKVGSLCRTRGRLHDRLHALPAPERLSRRFATADDDRVPHPGNVLLTRSGPMVTGRRTAGADDPAADVAMTVVTADGAEVPGPPARAGSCSRTACARAGGPTLRDASGKRPGPGRRTRT
ncbi:hypothetical protein ACIO87_10370 [Streptomyces sp. NPDC087218]|uniref:hypothetical protein n=1 Tax=Streptomyces sp. NPDC087218 TaxID=3365769 RepID=UPI003811A4BF